MNQDLIRKVWRRAQNRCEYCRLPAAVYPLPFHVDHIIARQHGGETALDNLALACLHCNRHKGPNIAGRDAETGEIARLDFKVTYATNDDPNTGASIFAALQEQLGLKLEATKGLVEMLVIDSVGKPSAN